MPTLLTALVRRNYSIQIEHDIKFVFQKIRFSSGFNLINNNEKFLKFQNRFKIKNPKLEFDNLVKTRMISPIDCYNQCMNENDCNSFSFCKYISSKLEIKCLLSDLILVNDEHEDADKNLRNYFSLKFIFQKLLQSIQRLSNQQAEQLLEKDKNCQTYSINYLKHFSSKGNSILATFNSLLIKSDFLEKPEDCARNCIQLNREEKKNQPKCGKLEVCFSDDKETTNKYECNLKAFTNEREIQLKSDRCEYFKINSLVDYHQTELNENGYLEIHSIFKTIDDCARNCTSQDDECKEFNFCYHRTLEQNSYEEEEGYCLWRVAKSSKSTFSFNASDRALNCITMKKNNQIIAHEQDPTYSPDQFATHIYRYKFIEEFDSSELSEKTFKLFFFVFLILGTILGWIGFAYYSSSIHPAYAAEKGTYFLPTRRFIVKNEGDLENQSEVNLNNNETEVDRTDNKNREIKEIKKQDEFTDVKL